MKREELVALRKRLIVGDPPYTKDPTGNLVRPTGVRGLDELRVLGDYSPEAAVQRLSLEAHLLTIEHLLERMKP